MTGNKIKNSFWLFFFTLLILLTSASLLPSYLFDQFKIKKVDYLKPLWAKVKTTTTDTIVSVDAKGDTIKNIVTKTIAQDSIVQRKKREIVTLEDYSKDSIMLLNFMKALNAAKDSSQNCRIAYYGDSFIEGDIMTATLRAYLQQDFGGAGVGFLPIGSEVAHFRKSLPTESKGWSEYSIAKQDKKCDFGIGGTCFVPNALGAEFIMKPSRSINGVYLFFKSLEKNIALTKVFNRKHLSRDSLMKNEKLQKLMIVSGSRDTVKNLKLVFEDTLGLMAYGVSHEDGKGVYLDNFSIRGNSGLGLNMIKDKMFMDFQRFMNYKMIVLQYGINVSNPETKDFASYETAMVKLINRLKKLFPEASILLVSVGDRSHKQDDEYVTMPSIPILVESQRSAAKRAGIMFWNMFEAMGWENGMVKMVDANMGNKDYTHISFGGGSILAKELYKAIKHSYNQNIHE